MIAAILAAAILAAVPSPAPTPLKTIVNVRSRPLCTALRDLLVPFDRIEQLNDGTAASEQHAVDLYNRFNDELFPNDHPVIFASQAESQAVTILQRLHEMELALAASYRATPQGVSEQVDQMRSRIQSVIDLQRALANDVIVSAGLVEDGDVAAAINSHLSGGGVRTGLPAGSPSPGPRYTPAPPAEIAATPPTGTVARDLRLYSTGALDESLGSERRRLVDLRAQATAQCANP